MRPIERFTDRVQDYVRYRPRYPPEVLEILRRETGLTAEWVVADVGAGTGISSELFLDHGNSVVAVEPNTAMRAAAEGNLWERPGFRSVAGTAEATTLEPASADLVVCAQAFHWFESLAARREFVRILRPPGWVALLWNTRLTGATPLLQGYERLLLRYGTDYVHVRHDHVDGRRLDPFFGGPYVRRFVAHEQRLDREHFIGRVLSSSYTPREGDPSRDRMIRAFERLFRKHAVQGHVTLLYETEIYVGRLHPSP